MTPEEAEGFYEDDEDPAVVFAKFDSGSHVVTVPHAYDPAEQVRQGLDYIRETYGPGEVMPSEPVPDDR